MKYVLLVSYGTIAKGVYDAVNMLGSCGNRISYVCLSADNNKRKFNHDLIDRINLIIKEDKLINYDNIIIISDIAGKYPGNVALAKLANEEILNKTSFITGMNLPFVLKIMRKKKNLNKESINLLLNEAKDSIQLLNINVIQEES